jgi:Family of unknown function (DUF6390)
MSRAGALLAAQFSYMPNRLGYCGPEENRAMLDYLAEGYSDRGLEQILARFAGAFPYYSFIAAANGISDPFDRRVIEAYWIGNELLEQVVLADLCRYFEERFKGRFLTQLFRSLVGQVPGDARPHHNFHVFSMPVRAGHREIPYSLEMMDECRVSWGRVVADHDDSLLVEHRPLRFAGEDITLGPPIPRSVLRRFDGKAVVTDISLGNMVAIHWGCACHTLTTKQLQGLSHYTRLHLALANAQRRGTMLLER